MQGKKKRKYNVKKYPSGGVISKEQQDYIDRQSQNDNFGSNIAGNFGPWGQAIGAASGMLTGATKGAAYNEDGTIKSGGMAALNTLFDPASEVMKGIKEGDAMSVVDGLTGGLTKLLPVERKADLLKREAENQEKRNKLQNQSKAIDPNYQREQIKTSTGGLTIAKNGLKSVKKYKKGSIYIKPENKGKFTASAKKVGESVQQHAKSVLSDPNATPLQKKRANFARNAASWNKKEEGTKSVKDMKKTKKYNNGTMGIKPPQLPKLPALPKPQLPNMANSPMAKSASGMANNMKSFTPPAMGGGAGMFGLPFGGQKQKPQDMSKTYGQAGVNRDQLKRSNINYIDNNKLAYNTNQSNKNKYLPDFMQNLPGLPGFGGQSYAKGTKNVIIEIEGKEAPEIHTNKKMTKIKTLGTKPHYKGGTKTIAKEGDVVLPTQNSKKEYKKTLSLINKNAKGDKQAKKILESKKDKLPEDSDTKKNWGGIAKAASGVLGGLLGGQGGESGFDISSLIGGVTDMFGKKEKKYDKGGIVDEEEMLGYGDTNMNLITDESLSKNKAKSSISKKAQKDFNESLKAKRNFEKYIKKQQEEYSNPNKENMLGYGDSNINKIYDSKEKINQILKKEDKNKKNREIAVGKQKDNSISGPILENENKQDKSKSKSNEGKMGILDQLKYAAPLAYNLSEGMSPAVKTTRRQYKYEHPLEYKDMSDSIRKSIKEQAASQSKAAKQYASSAAHYLANKAKIDTGRQQAMEGIEENELSRQIAVENANKQQKQRLSEANLNLENVYDDLDLQNEAARKAHLSEGSSQQSLLAQNKTRTDNQNELNRILKKSVGTSDFSGEDFKNGTKSVKIKKKYKKKK